MSYLPQTVRLADGSGNCAHDSLLTDLVNVFNVFASDPGFIYCLEGSALHITVALPGAVMDSHAVFGDHPVLQPNSLKSVGSRLDGTSCSDDAPAVLFRRATELLSNVWLVSKESARRISQKVDKSDAEYSRTPKHQT